MTLDDAKRMFKSQYPDLKIIGYWQDAQGYVFNIEISSDYVGAAQFVVKNDGKIYGTNPMVTNLDSKKYVKL